MARSLPIKLKGDLKNEYQRNASKNRDPEGMGGTA